MSFEVTILGCGSATPTLTRNPTAQYVRINSAEFLIDCGEGTQLQLLRFKCKANKLKAIFISHLHGDHFFGLPGLLSTMHLMGRKNKITIYGPEPLKGILNQLFEASETTLRFPIEFISTQSDKKNLLLETQTFSVYSFPLNHRIPCTGFIFKEKEHPRNLRRDIIQELNIPIASMKSIKAGNDFIQPSGEVILNSELTYPLQKSYSYAFCSDTAPDEHIVESLKGIDWLYHEATFQKDLIDRAIDTFHSTAEQAAQMALQCGAKTLLIGHYSARYSDIEELKHEAESIFPNVIAVEDGMIFTIA